MTYQLSEWFAVARSDDAVPRHIVQTQLLGQELALWRDDDGAVNVWENRCPHRGARFSIGYNLGMELRCQYHAWRYATGSGRCSAIPAHPAMKPPATIAAKPYASAEKYGLIWVCLDSDADLAGLPKLPGDVWTGMRSVFVNSPAAALRRELGADTAQVVYFLQPVDEARTIIHCLVAGAPAAAARLTLQRRYNAELTALRDRLEQAS
jgi:phenylpropionate dioxygenase-like ring-hydroxylating dioxygenase large terminal subunit